MKNINAQRKKDSFEKNLINSRRKTNLIKSDGGKDVYNNIVQGFINNNNVKLYSRNSSLGDVFAEHFNRSIRDFYKRLVFERGDANWIDLLPTITRQYKNRIHSSPKLTPIQANLKKNEGFVYNILLDKRKIINPKLQINDLVRVADLPKTF